VQQLASKVDTVDFNVIRETAKKNTLHQERIRKASKRRDIELHNRYMRSLGHVSCACFETFGEDDDQEIRHEDPECVDYY